MVRYDGDGARVDRLPGGLRIVDYKTGAAPSPARWLEVRPREPQLPLYALTGPVDGVIVARLAADGVGLRGVTAADAGIPGTVPVASLRGADAADWPALVRRWRSALEALAAEFAAGCVAIDANSAALADGEFAMLTRLHDVEPTPSAAGATQT